MRVAIFAETYFPYISGVVTHIQTLKKGLEAEGHEVLIVTLNPKTHKHYIKDGVLYCPALPLKKIYGYGVANPVNLRRLQILEKFNPDIIHLHTEFSMGIFALFAAKRLKKPVVYTLHTMYDDYVFYLFPNKKMSEMAKPAAHAYIRKVANGATEIIGPSHKVAEYLQRCGVAKKTNIIPNTVDVSAFLPENVQEKDIEAVKNKLGITPQDVCLCFVGRLGKEKSIDVLIDHFTKGYKGKQNFKLFIIGDGPEKESLQAQIEQLGMEEQVHLLGRIEHNVLPPYYRAFDLFSTASLSEMNSISLLEATASGLYAVNRLDINNLDQIKVGQNGNVFTTPAEFAEIVDEYAALTPVEKKHRKTQVTAYAKRYGSKEFTHEVLKVYNKAIEEFYHK
ncbi:glycosyltransferase [Ruminococcaceae bacterium OttesenSCG-928-A16]|nr:glycosyltransferase [Ruminococcaceae bacterium OttesenSCG-928-A16]